MMFRYTNIVIEKCVKCTKMYSRKQTRETFEINIHRLECHARVSPSSHTIFKSKGWQNVHHFPTKLLISIYLNGNMINTNAKVLYMSFLYDYKLHSSCSIYTTSKPTCKQWRSNFKFSQRFARLSLQSITCQRLRKTSIPNINHW